MKYLVLLAVVLAVIWLLRASRRGRSPRGNAPGGAPAPQPQDMVECPICQLHLPRAEALPGPDGRLYCCAEHRMRAGA
jgi:uncharacterized protein